MTIPTVATGRRGRDGGRRRDAGTSGSRPIPQLARRKIERAFPPVALISDDEVESIHVTSLRVLEEVGMDFMLDEARVLLKQAGAEVDVAALRSDWSASSGWPIAL